MPGSAAEGRSLLVLVPSEVPGMTAALQKAKVPLRPTSVDTARAGEQLTPALQALLSKTPELKVGPLAEMPAPACWTLILMPGPFRN